MSSWTHHVKWQEMVIGPIIVDHLVKGASSRCLHHKGALFLLLTEKYPIVRYVEALYSFFIILWCLGQVLL